MIISKYVPKIGRDKLNMASLDFIDTYLQLHVYIWI